MVLFTLDARVLQFIPNLILIPNIFVINVAICNILEESLSMSYLHNLSAEKTFVCPLWKVGIAAHFPLENLPIYFF